MASSHRLAKRQQQNMDAILASLARIESHLGIAENDTKQNTVVDVDSKETNPRTIYESMTIDELRSYASEAEIDLKGAGKKSDIVDALMLFFFPEEMVVS